ncbi:MAG: hypothetical protein Q9M48_01865 [Rhodobacterales bacterium]|nr:hypothetical protein [Rhodobacterales bacterium]
MLAHKSKNHFSVLAMAAILSLSAQGASATQSPQPSAYNPNSYNPNSYNSGQLDTSGSGQWLILSNGCSYSRAQAPGYPMQWILILNPHHIGGKYVVPSMKCKSSMGG